MEGACLGEAAKEESDKRKGKVQQKEEEEEEEEEDEDGVHGSSLSSWLPLCRRRSALSSRVEGKRVTDMREGALSP